MAATKTATKASKVFTKAEKDAMVQRASEVKSRPTGDVDPEQEVMQKIAAMPPADRTLAERIHKIVKASAPELKPRLWYGMPAYYKNGKLVCHFLDARKFKTRYATFAFDDGAKLDDGAMWPVAYALTTVTGTEEARIAALIKKAAS